MVGHKTILKLLKMLKEVLEVMVELCGMIPALLYGFLGVFFKIYP